MTGTGGGKSLLIHCIFCSGKMIPRELLETGKLEPDDVFLFGMDYEEAQADEGEEDPGEDQSGDAGGEQSDAPSEPGEDQP